ncbi:unnamed protein product [Nezara viridula]|uniref:Nuclear receptor domain-containing protein n=1 Tax=Nezara viridula TaxID=85310 RepID=A0A9P0HNT9_NEZVI|nr:unnamed protein product [Nezara viridula]
MLYDNRVPQHHYQTATLPPRVPDQFVQSADAQLNIEFDGTTVLCRVCGDKASGFHYGVHSCEGCKVYISEAQSHCTLRGPLTPAVLASGERGCPDGFAQSKLDIVLQRRGTVSQLSLLTSRGALNPPKKAIPPLSGVVERSTNSPPAKVLTQQSLLDQSLLTN